MKYYNTRTCYEGIFFGSNFECEVYKTLRAKFVKEDIVTHKSWSAESHAKEKHDDNIFIQPVTWRPDLFIPEYNLYVEAKGRFATDDYWKLHSFFQSASLAKYVHPELIVVCQGKPPSKRWFCRNKHFFKAFISWRDWSCLMGEVKDFDDVLRLITEREEDSKWQ